TSPEMTIKRASKKLRQIPFHLLGNTVQKTIAKNTREIAVSLTEKVEDRRLTKTPSLILKREVTVMSAKTLLLKARKELRNFQESVKNAAITKKLKRNLLKVSQRRERLRLFLMTKLGYVQD